MFSYASLLTDNSFWSSVVQFICTYVSTYALDSVYSRIKDKCYKCKNDVLWQLLHCMQEAHKRTCEQLNWEYDLDIYNELSVDILNCNIGLNDKKTLVKIFSNVVGGEISFKDIECWINNFQISLASNEHRNLCELIKIKSMFDNSNISSSINNMNIRKCIQKFIQPIVFDDQYKLSLRDMYIPNEYKLNGDEFIHRDLLELISAFIGNRIKPFLKQKNIIITDNVNALFVFGHQCTGKSTLISKLIYDNYLNNSSFRNNMYVCNFSDSSFREIDLTPYKICKYLEVNINSLTNATLIIDGLDESEWSSSIAMDKLEHLINDLSEYNCKLIVTSRSNFLYTVDIKNTLDIQLTPFSINQAIKWLEIYKEYDPNISAPSVIEQINNLTDDIKDIILIPYVFQTCINYGIKFESITELAQLYDIIFFDDTVDLLRATYNLKNRNTQTESNLYRDIIIELAIYSLHDSSNSIPSKFIDGFIQKNSIPSNKITSEFLLYRKDTENYSFIHNSIPHYFIARHLYKEFLTNSKDNRFDILIDIINHIDSKALVLPSSIFEFVEYFVRSNCYNDTNTPISFLKLFLSNQFDEKLNFTANLKQIQQYYYLCFINIVRWVLAFISPSIEPFHSFDLFSLLTNEQKKQFINYSNFGNASLECLKICSFSNHNLDGLNFRGINLRGKSIRNCSMKNLNMNSATLVGAYFIESDLSLSNFDNSNCKNVDFTGSILYGCSFKNARLNGANFEKANLDYADLRGSLLNKCKFVGASVKKTKIQVEQLRTMFDFDLDYIRNNKMEVYCEECLLPDELLEDEFRKQRPVGFALFDSSKRNKF